MTHTTRTLALTNKWDIYLTESGRIALREGPISTAQSVANEIRRFMNDSYFDYDVGIPHYLIELGHNLPASILRGAVRNAALRVEDVSEILTVNVTDFDPETRILTGDISFRTVSGEEISMIL